MAMMSSFSRFFKKNRNYIFNGVVFSSILGSYAAGWLPHSFLLDYYKDFVQMYRHGLPVDVPENIQQHFEAVMNDMKLDEKERNNFHPYTVFGFDCYTIGSTLYHQGAHIGIPVNFHFKVPDDIPKGELSVNNSEDVAWSSPAGKSLLESLILSEEAQKFAIAREIRYGNSPDVLLQSWNTPSNILLAYTMCYHINDRLVKLGKPRSLRVVGYTLACIFSFGMWCLLRDSTRVYYEYKSDTEALKMGKSYAQGGVEFYTKILQRNIALRELAGKTGEGWYTAYGNRHSFLRQKNLPYTKRKESALQILKEYDAE